MGPLARRARAVVFAAAMIAPLSVARAEPTIIPCEGPAMPAACPQPPSPAGPVESAQAARAAFLTRQASALQLQQQFTARRQGLAGQMDEARRGALARQPQPQTSPWLNPPNFKAAAAAIAGVIAPGNH